VARAWAWGLGLIAMTGLAAVCARSIGAESHVTASATPIDPACVAGADYSAAVCNAASAGLDAPISAAGRDYAAPKYAMTSKAPVIASAETTAIPAPAKAPFLIASVTPTTPTLSPGERLSNQARSLTETAEQSGYSTAMGFRRQISSFARAQAPLRRKLASQDLARRLGQAGDFGDRARLYIFAGGGTGVVGYNITSEQGEVSASGWSYEKTAKMGSSQIGMAWKRGGLGFALIGAQRKLAQFGASIHDSVVSLRFSWSPGTHHNQAPSS
jgi:hypothetical protein